MRLSVCPSVYPDFYSIFHSVGPIGAQFHHVIGNTLQMFQVKCRN